MNIKDSNDNLRKWNVNNITSTVIKLYNASLNLTSGSQIWFESEEAQLEYFDNCVVHTFENCTYVRIEEGFTMLPLNVEQLRHECNYISIQNKGFDDKIYYCNLLSMDWVNVNTTKLNFAVDTIQTYLFDMDISLETHIVRRTYTHNGDGKRKIWATLDENINTGVLSYRVEQGLFYSYEKTLQEEINEEQKDVDVYRSLSSTPDDRCYVLACSQALKRDDGGTFGVRFTNTLPITTQVDFFNGESIQNQNLNFNTSFGYHIMTYNYVCNDEALGAMNEKGFLTNERNNGVVTQILTMPLPYGYMVDGAIGGDNPYGQYAGISSGKMCDLNDLRTYNEMTAFVGTEMMNYYSLAMENAFNSGIDDNSYSSILRANALRKNPSVFYENALIDYFMKPYLTRFTINDHNNNIIDYDIRFLNYGNGLDDYHTLSDQIASNNMRYFIAGYKTTLLTFTGVSPIPVVNWIMEGYGYNNAHTKYTYTKSYTRQGSRIEIDQTILNNDYWLKMIPSIYMPIVSDYYSMFLQANTYQLNAQRGNIHRTYATAVANATAMRDAQMNANWLNYQGNLASARALQANASIQYGASLQIAQNNYNNAINISQNNLATQMANASEAWQGAYVDANALYGEHAQGKAKWSSYNLNLLDGFGIIKANANESSVANQYSSYTINADVQRIIAETNAFNNQQNAYMNATTTYNNALIQASATAQMLRNTAQAQMTQAYNAYKGQQGILNANYQNELRSAATTQQNAIDMLNATIKDAQNVADSVTADYQGDNTPFITNSLAPTYHFSVIQPEFIRRVIMYFLMFGFTANTYENPKDIIDSWEHGGYIQTSNIVVSGEIPYQWKIDIANQFNAGIRFWKNPDDYLDYSVLITQ